MQDVAAANCEAVDGGDHRLRDRPDQAVQRLDLVDAALGGAVVACLRLLLHVAAGAECSVARARQHDRSDVPVRPGPAERGDQLFDGPASEGVHPVGTVDRDHGDALVDVIADVREVDLVHRTRQECRAAFWWWSRVWEHVILRRP